MGTEVLFYVPNIICYFRLLVQIYAIAYMVTNPFRFLFFTWLSCCFDFFDGIAARKLNQMSRFGEILDVLLDNFSRSALWIGTIVHTPDPPFILFLLVLYILCEEWFTFLCAQLMAAEVNQSHWKMVNKTHKDPWWVSVVFDNGFKNIYGFFAIGSTWSLPFWYIAYNVGYRHWIVVFIVVISIPSRIYCSVVCLYIQAKFMLNAD